jgi:hypothetical protein
MQHRNFIRAAASSAVAAGLGGSSRLMSAASPNPPVMELRVAPHHTDLPQFSRPAFFYRSFSGH